MDVAMASVIENYPSSPPSKGVRKKIGKNRENWMNLKPKNSIESIRGIRGSRGVR